MGKILEKKGIIIAFGELFLKSESVRRIFRKKLENNIFFLLKKENIVYKNILSRDRIFIETEEIKKAKKILKDVFGIAWFSEAFYFSSFSLKEISSFIALNYKNFIKEKDSFSIRIKIEKGVAKEEKEEIIKELANKIKNRKVNLKKPKKEINIEIRKTGVFLYFKKEKGKGGLPISSSGRVLSLMSGGIDSPVASYLMFKRGIESIWIHFHSFPFVSNKSIEKVKETALLFLKYQPKIRVYFVPFSDLQKEIRLKTKPSIRILLYRRKMLEIANIIAEAEKCEAIITGESLGQVSSQTLSNIVITSKSSKLPIFRPLISNNKEEIIETAREIKTYEISIKPQEDCCTLFTPKKASAKGDLKEVEGAEKKIDKKIIGKTIKAISFIDIIVEK